MAGIPRVLPVPHHSVMYPVTMHRKADNISVIMCMEMTSSVALSNTIGTAACRVKTTLTH